jgi:hypothetical protein
MSAVLILDSVKNPVKGFRVRKPGSEGEKVYTRSPQYVGWPKKVAVVSMNYML